MNFGGANWSSSSGFGAPSQAGGSVNAANPNNAKPGLFGASQLNSGGLFGNTTNNNTSGGLFGGSNQASAGFNNTAQNTANTNAQSGGLFGNSGQTGGLFGNSTAPNASAGGLFGSSNASKPAGTTGAATGLFGNSNATSNTAGGLFGGAQKSGGLFGASTTTNQPATGGATGGLFGNSNNTQAGGLFGGSAANSQKPGLSTQSGGLFGGSSGNQGGLFGNNAPAGGLFGNSNSGTTNTGGLFSSSNTNPGVNPNVTTTSNPNPYSSDGILSTISNTTSSMPQSITGSLFAPLSQQKRAFSNPDQPQSLHSNPSLLGRLAQTFKIFRANTDSSDSSISRLKGLFTQLNFIKDAAPVKNSGAGVKKTYKKAFNLPVDNKNVGEIKRLVIKSKPLKFHLINADKVFNAKRRRILTLSLNPGRLIASTMSDEEDSDTDIEIENHASHKAQAVMGGEPYLKSEDKMMEEDNIEANNGYWCSPSLLELSKLSLEQLSQIDNFIVGRVGHGQIAYNYPVNLSDLFVRCQGSEIPLATALFGRIVKIDGSVVRVYDDEQLEKPGIGFELNVPATITIKAAPKKNHSKSEHIKRLQNFTGMEFVTFDPITNNWTFKVKHFSVWGLIDDSEEEEGNEEMARLKALKKKQDLQEDEASQVYTRIYENEAYNQELKRQKIGNYTTGLPGGWENETTYSTGGLLVVKQQIVRREIDRQVDLYKHDKSAIALAANVSDITVDSDTSSDGESPDNLEPLYPIEANNYDYLKNIVSVLPPNTDMKDLVDEKAYEPEISDEAIFNRAKPALATSSDWLLQLELSNDIDSALTPYLTVPRKTQLTLRAVNDIVFSDFNHSVVDLNQISTPIKETKDPKALVNAPQSYNGASVVKLVQNLLLKSTVTLRDNGFPAVTLDPSLTFKELSSIELSESDCEALKLASILFDKIDIASFEKYKSVDPNNTELVSRLITIEQRKAFSEWLKTYNMRTASFPQSDDALDSIFTKICQGDLKSAVQTAIASHNTHLSALLTLLGSNDLAVRNIAENQLVRWDESGATDLIPVSVYKLFQILAGQFGDVSADLPYSVSLGLQLYYGNPAEELRRTLERAAPHSSSDDFHSLLQIYSTLKAYGAATDIEDSQLSAKQKWLFSTLLNLHGEAPENESIIEDFGDFLQSVGLWKEAIYVNSTLSDDAQVKAKLRDIIISNLQSIKGEHDEEEFLVTVLRVPRSLIYEAVAINKSNLKDYWGKGEALVEAKLWTDAHDNIIEKLGPMTVVLDDYELKQKLADMTAEFPNGGAIIPGWNQGAGMFASYFDIVDAYNDQQRIDGDSIGRLLSNLALFQADNSFTTTVAKNIMAKKTGDIALESKDVSDIKQKISALPLGENEKLYFKARLGPHGVAPVHLHV